MTAWKHLLALGRRREPAVQTLDLCPPFNAYEVPEPCAEGPAVPYPPKPLPVNAPPEARLIDALMNGKEIPVAHDFGTASPQQFVAKRQAAEEAVAALGPLSECCGYDLNKISEARRLREALAIRLLRECFHESVVAARSGLTFQEVCALKRKANL